MKHCILLTILLVLFGCSDLKKRERSSADISGLTVSHALKFKVEGNRIVVTEPWPGAVEPLEYSIGQAPQRVVCTSTTYLPFLEMLGVENTLVGFPGTRYINSEKIRAMVKEGKVTDLGPDGSMNVELLLSLRPDIVFAFDMGNESTMLDKLEEAGIKIVYNADYLEPTSLGRAEWIKFFGAFYHKTRRADSLFSNIAATYDSLKQLAADVDERPTVLSGVMYGHAWFLPGGENSSGQFFKDAGGDYLWGNNPATGWLELSFETVFEQAHDADYWIGISTFNSLDELKGEDTRYADFKAFKTKKVYNYHKRVNPTGGYDYFESGYARPDLVLADIIKILHPDLLPGYETYYFRQVL